MTAPTTLGGTETCSLQHKLFAFLRVVAFQRAEADGAPALVVVMGDKHAALPLDSLAREFAIMPDSHDGRMFAAIARALDFVPAIRLGDRLPEEALSGEPSWRPSPQHGNLAQARMKSHLVDWLTDWMSDGPADDARAAALAADPSQRARDNAAIEQAAETLGLPNGEAVLDCLGRIAAHLAFIEALRERLLSRAERMAGWVAEAGKAAERASSHHKVVAEVRRLMEIALLKLRERFERVDAAIAEIISTLRDEDGRTAFIRAQRDWLNRALSAWEPMLLSWEMVNRDEQEAVWPLIGQTYRFLARRYMPAKDWLAVAPKVSSDANAVMVW